MSRRSASAGQIGQALEEQRGLGRTTGVEMYRRGVSEHRHRGRSYETKGRWSEVSFSPREKHLVSQDSRPGGEAQQVAALSEGGRKRSRMQR